MDIPEFNNLDTSALPNLEETKNLFKEKCTKNGGPDAFDNANQARIEMEQCVKSLVNVTELQAEMEKYKPTGDLDIVFKNYCNKRSILRACVKNFTDAVEHCLDDKERASTNILMNITDSMLEFVCFKEGDRIARMYTNQQSCLYFLSSDANSNLMQVFSSKAFIPKDIF